MSATPRGRAADAYGAPHPPPESLPMRAMTDRCLVPMYGDDCLTSGVDRWRSTGKEVTFDPNTTDSEEEELDELALYTPAPPDALYPRPWACVERRLCPYIRWKDGADCWPYGQRLISGPSNGLGERCKTAFFHFPADHDRPFTCGTSALLWVHRRHEGGSSYSVTSYWLYPSDPPAGSPSCVTRSLATCRLAPFPVPDRSSWL